MKGILLTVLDWIRTNLELLNAAGSSGYVTSGIGAFAEAYHLCRSIATNVCQPIAYSLLALFGLLDLFHTSLQLQQQGGGSSAPLAALKTGMKFAVVKWAVDHAADLLAGIFSVAGEITASISTSGVDLASYADPLQQQIEATDFDLWGGVGCILLLFVTYLATWAAIIGVTYIILSRFVQVYFFVALSSIPLSFFEEQHAMQMGLSFFRGFASVALQSAVIVLALRLYPAFASALAVSGDTLAKSCLNIAMLTIILLGTVVGSGQVAKAVFGT